MILSINALYPSNHQLSEIKKQFDKKRFNDRIGALVIPLTINNHQKWRYVMRTYHQQYAENVYSHLTKWLKRKSRKISQEMLDAALILMRINLDSAQPYLKSLYSPNPRGRKPYDPICMLRSLLMMILMRYTSITLWAKALRQQPRLAVLCGFASSSREPVKTPSAGAFYQFIDRLEDGGYQKPCDHYIKPSRLRKIKILRNLKDEKAQRKAQKESDMAEYDSATKKLKEQLKAKEEQPRPDDLLKRLEDIFIQCAVIPSAQRGLLGDTESLDICGDGSPLPTGASSYGKPVCNCRDQGIYNCDCDRYYTDATADWGYDSYRDCYYFGHTYYQHVVSSKGHDLPLHVSVSRASETDFTLSMKDMDRLKKGLKEHGLDWGIGHGIYDAGHDAVGNYEYLMEHGVKPVIALNPRSGTHPAPTPVIALNPRSGTHPAPTGNAKVVNEKGVPLCPGGKPMRRHGYSSTKHRIYYNCPAKRPNGSGEWIYHREKCPLGVLCDPDTKMGPVVYVKTTDDLRLYPPVSKTSPEYKKLMNLRSGCERSNAQKKEVYGLGSRPCRSDTHFLVRLYLISIIEHAKAWLAEDMKKQGSDNPQAFLEAMAA